MQIKTAKSKIVLQYVIYNERDVLTFREVIGDSDAVTTYEVKELKSKFDQLQGEHHKLIGE